ncbi:S-layer homology domain-containing protein [Fontibacillus panacisegetis]|uniref:S-layer homology domain-containing protein n=1 Tax=Fontibacillus panacisegetis TaxID=670482 RepID=A0A1G7VB17_9BACL|nr:S-layer homology domain-containing protein [Fontibacillus panacisegetis]SDG56996.1 S-layer homology domain-containing protein [Fontibacillus panacisegetis]
MNLKVKKRIISLSTAMITVFSSVVPAFAASVADPADSATKIVSQSQSSSVVFSDTSNHWGQAAIEKWNEYGVVKGYNGTFRPDAPVTRAEFSTMIDNIVKYIAQANNDFTDLKEGQWYYNSILKLNTAGVLKGIDGKALPDNKITRQEAALLMAGAFEIGTGESTKTFKDHDQIAGWAKDAVQALVSKAVISGNPDGTFKPTGNLTRAEAVTLFDNLIQTLISKPGEYSKDVSGNLVINTSGAVLKNMKIAGDLYITQGVGEGEVTLENVVIAGTVHVQGGGVNSIIFNNVDVQGALVVNKYNGQVRILATGNTSVSVTVLESGAMLVTKELTGGGFETVEISADILAGQEVKLDGNFNNVVNRAADIKITANGTIKELVAEANAVITGTVKINSVTGAKGSSVTLNEKPVNTTIPSGGGSSSGGGTSSGGTSGGGTSGGDSTTVAVKGISITPSSLSLFVGESKQLEATITPSNATNKKIVWTVDDNSAKQINVTADGLVTAKGPGTGTVTATTQDGGFKANVVVHVQQSAIGVNMSSYSGAVIDSETQVEEAVRLNSSNVKIAATSKSLIQENHYETTISALSALQQTSVTHSVYSVVTLNNINGQPITDPSGISVTLNGLPYSVEFGDGIAEGYKAGSFVLKLDIDEPEKIQQYHLVFTKEGYANTSLTVTYRPVGAVSLQNIEAVAGQPVIGTQLTAGSLNYDGVPANHDVSYQWYRADSENGAYTAIAGANATQYELTTADGGKYIRVGASADGIEVSGSVLSPAFGPIEKPINIDEVFTAIEAIYLGSNANKSNVTSNLILSASLEAYPGVTITWSSSQQAIVTNAGVVTRNELNDEFVTLTATLGGKVTGTRSYELIVRAVGTDNVGTDGYIDPYFTNDYPQAYVKDGTIHVKYALNKPAEVYMVVNVINGTRPSDVKAVIEGHAGINNDIIYVDKWPYFQLDSTEVNQVQDFDTGVNVAKNNNREARVEFVIVDQANNYTSSDVTTVLFDKTVVGALDTYPPRMDGQFINDALDTIYIYFDEYLDSNSVPAAGDFTLSVGQVDNVTIYNYDNGQHRNPSYVKLSVSGITQNDADKLKLSYIGSALQDISDAKNKVQTFVNKEVMYTNEFFSSVTISSDRKSIIAVIVPGWYTLDNSLNLSNSEEIRSRFSVEIDGLKYPPFSGNYSYNSKELTYTLKFNTPLPVGAAVLKFNSSGIVNWAKDPYPSELVSQEIVQIPAPGIPTATYSSNSSTINLTFADGFDFNYASLSAGLVLKVDGVEYALRGFIVRRHVDYVNGQMINRGLSIDLNEKYSWKYKNAIEAGSDIQIKYTKLNGDDDLQLSDKAGALLPDFDFVQVTKLSQ